MKTATKREEEREEVSWRVREVGDGKEIEVGDSMEVYSFFFL